jgi:thymidylate synthase (FAD)
MTTSEEGDYLRPSIPALDAILGKQHKVLDHGFIRVIDYMGDDSSITQAARVSYGKGTKQISEDKGLINYLMRHKHTTPFEMCDIKFHIKAPIFVARQWLRHRTSSVNEYSARYSILSKEFYIPTPEHMAVQSTINKQGRDEALPSDTAQKLIEILQADAERCYADYEYMLSEGLTRELARINLNLNYYTEWYWKVNLHNLLHFLKLRVDSHAQYEIRVYAETILDVVKLWVPFAYQAFEDYILNSYTLSKKALDTVIAMINGEQVTQESSGLTKREWLELTNALKLNLKD